MTNKNLIATVTELDGDAQVNNLKKELKKSHLYELAAIGCFILLAVAVGIIVFTSTEIKFAIVHPQEARQFATGYYRVEKASKDAASELITKWVMDKSVYVKEEK